MEVADITREIVGREGADAECPPCAEPEASLSAVTVAVVVLLAVALIYHLVCFGAQALARQRESYVSRQAYEVTERARDLFSQTQGKGTYSEYKTRINGADPVQYDDVRNLWEKGKLSPSNVQKVL